MKKLLFISILFIFASSASASIYKWVDAGGAVNFTDDYDRIPPGYRDKVEKMNIPKEKPATPTASPPGNVASGTKSGERKQAPPVSQTLIREGDFAVKLAEGLSLGKAKNEAEAEDLLTSVGIAPRNGWIADYPVTPVIIGELQNAIGSASDSGKLKVRKDEAVKALQGLTADQGLPVRADTDDRGAEGEPSVDYSQYSNPEDINNYYENEGPPIITYYPPPWDYNYLYSWVPYPFWYTGCWFPGFFVLRDFHKGHFAHGHARVISNHFRNPRTGEFSRIDPAGRRGGNRLASVRPSRGEFTSRDAAHGASSILNRSRRDTGLNRTTNGRFMANRPRSGMIPGSPRGRETYSRSVYGSSSGLSGGFMGHETGKSSGSHFGNRSGGSREGGHGGGGGSSRGGGGAGRR